MGLESFTSYPQAHTDVGICRSKIRLLLGWVILKIAHPSFTEQSRQERSESLAQPLPGSFQSRDTGLESWLRQNQVLPVSEPWKVSGRE